MTEKHNTTVFIEKPESILPFELDREQASQIFLHTFTSDRMAPTEFTEAVHHNCFGQRYFPVFLFSCDVITSIDAECTQRNDDSINLYRSQRTVKTQFSDIIACAGTPADDMLLHLLEPYDIERAVDFTDEYRSDAEIEIPEISYEEIFARIKPELEKQALLAAEKTLNKFTDKRTIRCTHCFENITVQQLLLPMWVLECNCGSRPYSIFLNGQTGRVAGVPPRSRKKAAAIICSAAAAGAAAAQFIWMAVNAIW